MRPDGSGELDDSLESPPSIEDQKRAVRAREAFVGECQAAMQSFIVRATARVAPGELVPALVTPLLESLNRALKDYREVVKS